MNFLSVTATLWCLASPLLSAQVVAPPFTMDKPSSADLSITMGNGTSIHSRTFLDGEKIRADVTMNGLEMSTIVRKDQRKIYQLLPAQKMAMEMDYDPAKFKGYAGAAAGFGPNGQFELVGPSAIDGIACTEYKVTSDKTKQVFFFWLDTVHKVPVKMTAADGSLSVKWTNYQPGPQDPALFEVPSGYEVTPMMGMPGTSGGAAP